MLKRMFLFAALAAILLLILTLAKVKVKVAQREPPTKISPFLEALSIQEF